MRIAAVIAMALLIAAPAAADGAAPAHRMVVGAEAQGAAPRSPARRIACTRTGCRDVPPGCSVEIERTLDGSPSGFEMIICR